MTTRQITEKPLDFPGTLPEYVAFQTLVELGKRPGMDFIFQSSIFGGRTEKGGLIIDFLFNDPPDLAINIQGIYFHYGLGSSRQANDVLAREILAGQGITMIFIDEDDILNDPRFYVREALNYQDHSRLTRGI